MSNTNKKKEENGLVVTPSKKELVLEGDPEQQLAFAMKAANALMKAVKQKPKPVMIRGEQYLEYGDWQTLARFFGATASVAWTKPMLDAKGNVRAYEARAEVLHNGVVISSAEAMCTREEPNWRTRDEFMLRSMAQTRASAKALRNAYGWVAELAGMKATPAEEMGSELYDITPIKADAVVVSTGDDTPGLGFPDEPVKTKLKRPEVIEKVMELDDKKKEIKKLIDRKVLAPIDQTAEAYQEYVKENTALDLVPENYDSIIELLQS